MNAWEARGAQHIALLAVTILALLISYADQLVSAQPVQDPPANIELAQSDDHPPLWFDEVSFSEAVRNAPESAVATGDVVGGIIPQHWFAGHLITGFFAGLAAQKHPETIILIGPNHTNSGQARMLTSDRAWSTPFGRVEADLAIIETLKESGLVELGGDALTPEHSVAGIMPAIRYYLPAARVVPIILAGNVGLAEAERLAAVLTPLVDEDTVLVASVDFSHYLIQSEASVRDELTLEALRSFDSARLFTLDNDYLDSPPSIAVLLEAMRRIGSDGLALFENTNSGLLAGDELAPTTSYFAGYYYRSK